YDGCLPVKLGSRGALRARPLVAAKRVSANGWALALLSLRPMHLRLLLPLAIVLCLAAAPALAQRRPVAAGSSTPETGELAAGASIGVSLPSDQFFGNGVEVAGNIEGYVTPRVSARAQAGMTWWNISDLRGADEMKPLFLTANLVYNWELGS